VAPFGGVKGSGLAAKAASRMEEYVEIKYHDGGD
jgi:hypothetical protein